jgi:hypothetical protein
VGVAAGVSVGVGVATGLGLEVGRGVGRGVGRAVRVGVGDAVGRVVGDSPGVVGDGSTVGCGVPLPPRTPWLGVWLASASDPPPALRVSWMSCDAPMPRMTALNITPAAALVSRPARTSSRRAATAGTIGM